MEPRGSGDRQADDIFKGLPQTPGGGLTPLSRIEQAGKVADGLTRLTGWRRSLARWGVIVLLSVPLVLMVISAAAQK